VAKRCLIIEAPRLAGNPPNIRTCPGGEGRRNPDSGEPFVVEDEPRCQSPRLPTIARIAGSAPFFENSARCSASFHCRSRAPISICFMLAVPFGTTAMM
jgi:hypothetical protein